VGKLVDDDDIGASRDDGVEVELLEHDAAILDPAPRHQLEILHPGCGLRAAVRLDEPHDDVDARPTHRVRVVEHLPALADPRGHAEVHLQLSARLVAFREAEQVVGIRSEVFGRPRHGPSLRLLSSPVHPERD
jgi:hypothetical protein